MSKKAWVIGGSTVGVLVVIAGAGAGYWYFRIHIKAPQPLVQAVQGASSSDSVSFGTDLTKAIPLGGQASESESSLRVTSNGGLGGGTEQANGGQAGGSGASSGSRSASSKLPGPEGFSVYDQYKTSKDAMYVDTVPGNGAAFDLNKKGAVYYKGWLTTGELFDQTKPDKPGGQMQPFVFTMGEHKVIPGWEMGLYGMKAGGTRRIIVPPTVGYGDTGQGPIPPGAVLVFDVQLLAVQ